MPLYMYASLRTDHKLQREPDYSEETLQSWLTAMNAITSPEAYPLVPQFKASMPH